MGRLAGQAKSPLEKLEDYSPTFLDWRSRYNRSLVPAAGRLVCGDPMLDLSFHASEKHINGLLEQYHAFLGGVAFSATTAGVLIPESSIPAEHTDKVYNLEVSDGLGEN